jgi:hypothetical protein
MNFRKGNKSKLLISIITPFDHLDIEFGNFVITIIYYTDYHIMENAAAWSVDLLVIVLYFLRMTLTQYLNKTGKTVVITAPNSVK